MIVLGLTGSIGMGKSTTADMFRALDIPVHDADATVHRLYQKEVVPLIEKAFPGTTTSDGVDRGLLSKQVIGNEAAMKRLEKIIHPMVQAEKEKFMDRAQKDGLEVVVLDNPLLFEMKADKDVDGIIVVTAPKEVQRQRVLARDGMDEAKFEAILARQYPDDKKRQHADFVIDTSLGMEKAAVSVGKIVEAVRSGQWQPRQILKKQD